MQQYREVSKYIGIATKITGWQVVLEHGSVGTRCGNTTGSGYNYKLGEYFAN